MKENLNWEEEIRSYCTKDKGFTQLASEGSDYEVNVDLRTVTVYGCIDRHKSFPFTLSTMEVFVF